VLAFVIGDASGDIAGHDYPVCLLPLLMMPVGIESESITLCLLSSL
jgi:hypothetical protein